MSEVSPDNVKIENSEIKRNNNLVIPLIIIFCLMVIMVVYTSQNVRRVTVNNIHEVGYDKISSVGAKIENYLDTTKGMLWVTAETVDQMTQGNVSNDIIQQYLVEQTNAQLETFNFDYTGIYGYIGGEYLDGLNWVPDDGYVPTERDWYRQAVAAGGDTIIVPPYVDAQTGQVVITITRMLSNGEDVVAVDLTMEYIQELSTSLNVRDKGYGFIFDSDGLIIAHEDESFKGLNVSDIDGMTDLMEQAVSTGDGYFEMSIDGKPNTVFVQTVMGQWYVVIIISNAELYAESVQQISVNVLICVIIFVLIGLFYFLGYRNDRRYSKRIEEMREEEQRQAYEAQVLKFEKEAADTANKAKSDFLAQMSHEIRTPINAVIGMDEMILRETQDPDIKGYALDIKSASKTLLSLVNGVLDFSKIESGKMEIVPVHYKTVEMINDIVSMISDRAERKDLLLSLDIDPKLPGVMYGDDVRIKQVIINLLTNAVKYTEKGTVKLTMRVVDIRDNTCTIHVSVKDTGIGIKEEELDKLFDSFQRLDERRNRNIEGTGLGMAIVQGILGMMGSQIHVESNYGQGSVFSFSINQDIIESAPIGEYHVLRSSKREEEKNTLTILNADILVVDDNDINLKVAKGLMKRLNAVPDIAGSGTEAIDMIRRKHYDIILMDHMMPVIDGIETLKILHNQSLIDETTSVIALTANAIAGAREMYISEGFVDYLSKPIVPEDLENMLIKYLPSDRYRISTDDAAEDISEENTVEAKPSSDESEMLRSLHDKGFNVDAALTYCMNDEEFLNELMGSFVESSDEKITSIVSYHDSGNWTDYSTYVHALKSSSRTIGADSLSSLAQAQENASKSGDVNGIESGYEKMLNEYRRVIEDIRNVLGSCGDSSEDSDDDGDILEFFPEE